MPISFQQRQTAISGGATEAKQDSTIAAVESLAWSSLVEVDLSSTDATFSPVCTGVQIAVPGDLKFDGGGLTAKTIAVGVGPVPIPDLSKIYKVGTTATISYAGRA